MPNKDARKIASVIQDVREGLRSLDGALRRLIPTLASATQDGSQANQSRRRGRLSAKARASLVLQGRYMGYMRQLKPRQKAQVRKIREVKAVKAATERARELART